MKQHKSFDCVEMKREIQNKIRLEAEKHQGRQPPLFESLPKDLQEFYKSAKRIGESQRRLAS